MKRFVGIIVAGGLLAGCGGATTDMAFLDGHCLHY